MTTPLTAPQLIRGAGLLADGPVVWGQPVGGRRAGVFVIELSAPVEAPPIDHVAVSKWIERVPDLRLDGEPATARTLAARMATFWLPGQAVVFIGSTRGALVTRIDALYATPLGDPKPYAGAHWLRALQGLEQCRVWWAASEAPAEYEDALLDAFAAGLPPEVRSRAPDPDLVLPFAVLRRPTGERRAHGITNALLPVPDVPVAAATRATPTRAGRTTRARAAPQRSGPLQPRLSAAPGGRRLPTDEPVHLTAEGLERFRGELRDLQDQARPAAIKRVAAARELGDLKENSEYHAAREELGFIAGRIQVLESQLKRAVVITDRHTAAAGQGSTVVVRIADETEEYQLVGSPEADPAAGRISTSSPIGRALVGRVVGEDVVVRTPGGEQTVTIVEVR
jgi:transcription elongation factor GreA